jgi:hypothetical protein
MLGFAGLSLPILFVMTPAGVLGHLPDRISMLCQVGFLSSVLGAMLAVSALGECHWILSRAGDLRALTARWTAIGLAAALSGSIVIVSGALLGYTAGLSGALCSLGWTAAHLSALGAVVCALPVSPPQRVMAVPFLAWILPAATSPDSWWGRGLAAVLQASRDPSRFINASPASLLEETAPILAIGAAMLTMSVRRSQPRPR